MSHNYFVDLLQAEVRTEKKGKLTYASWIEVWAELKRRHPAATYQVHQTEAGSFLHGEGLVMCSVTVPAADIADGEAHADVTHKMWLPVMDQRNGQIQKPSTTDINKALMRCLAKCVAMHGLGAYVYMGEDLPEAPEPDPMDAYAKRLDKLATHMEGADDLECKQATAAVEDWPEEPKTRALALIAARQRALAAAE